jgi:hypothetical protein
MYKFEKVGEVSGGLKYENNQHEALFEQSQF